jgi:hypothetical protein
MSKSDQRGLSCLRQGFGLQADDGALFACPLAGMRAPEMAMGAWKRVFAELYDMVVGDLLQSVHVTGDNLAEILSDMEIAKVAAFDEMTIKFKFWDTLPWRFAALAHHDEDLARSEVGSFRKPYCIWKC